MSKPGAGLLAGLTMIVATAAGGAEEVTPQVSTQGLVVSFAKQVLRCWNPPISAQDGKRIVVRLNIRLSVDGRWSAMPTPTERLDISDPDVTAALRAATKAIYACAPYNLPAEQYSTWKEIVIAFDPRSL